MSLAELPPGFLLALAGLVGLCVGSFLNVVIYRTPKMMALNESDERLSLSYPSSHCPACQTPLRVRDLVPVLSWVLLQRRCAYCQTPIAIRYPAVELLNATLWVACAFKWSASWSALCWAICGSYLIALTFIDWDTTLLPDALTLPLTWIGLGSSALGWISITPQESIVGAIIGYSFLWIVSRAFERVTGKVGMGDGDLKLLAAIGAWLGPLAVIYVVVIASITGAVVGLILKQRDGLRDQHYLPFGPFLSCSALFLAFSENQWLTI